MLAIPERVFKTFPKQDKNWKFPLRSMWHFQFLSCYLWFGGLFLKNLSCNGYIPLIVYIILRYEIVRKYKFIMLVIDIGYWTCWSFCIRTFLLRLWSFQTIIILDFNWKKSGREREINLKRKDRDKWFKQKGFR